MLSRSAFLLSAALAERFGDWKITEVKSVLSWKEGTVDIEHKVKAKNIGKVAAKTIYAGLPQAFGDKVGLATASTDNKDIPLTVTAGTEASKLWSLALKEPVAPGKSVSFVFEMTLGHVFKPFPERSLMLEKNQVILNAPLTLLFPYPVDSVSASLVNIPGSVSDIQPAGRLEGSSIFWALTPTEPFHAPSLTVRAMHPHSIPNFKSVRRVVELSPWSNVVVSEEYQLFNEATALESEFSRLPFSYQKNMGRDAFMFRVDGQLDQVTGILPRYAKNVHYFDVIGNVSTSTGRRIPKQYVEVSLEPRFPLLGGWRTEFQFQYELPHKFVSKVGADGKLELSLPLNHPFVGVFTDSLELEVMLPEGASEIEVIAPRGISQVEFETRKSWFDTPLFGGHVVAKFRVNGSFFLPQREALNHKFTVRYRLGWFWEARPTLLMSLYVLILVAVIVALSPRAILPEPESPSVLSVASETSYTVVETKAVQESKKRK